MSEGSHMPTLLTEHSTKSFTQLPCLVVKTQKMVQIAISRADGG